MKHLWNRYKSEHYWQLGLINPFMLLFSVFLFRIELYKFKK